MNLTGKVAIVSGAAQGLGLAFARRLVQEGCQVLGFDINPEITSIAGITGVVADISKRQDVERIATQAAAMGDIAVLVNNAGTWKQTQVDDSWEQALTDWDFVMDTNFKGTLMLSRLIVPQLQSAGGGHIFNISTYYVLPAKTSGTNPADTDLYGASKWAMNGLTETWASSLARHNIKVNGLCMGPVDTAMLRGLFPEQKLPAKMAAALIQDADIAQQMMDVIESGRTGENFGAWIGEAIELGAEPPPHRKITG